MLDESQVRERLLALQLTAGHWAVHGSAALVLRGLLAEAGDVDVVARGPAWRRALELGEPKPGKEDLCVALPHLDVEVWSGWLGEDVDALIEGAEDVGGAPCVTLEAVLRFKERAGRPKDVAHAEAIRRALAAGSR